MKRVRKIVCVPACTHAYVCACARAFACVSVPVFSIDPKEATSYWWEAFC